MRATPRPTAGGRAGLWPGAALPWPAMEELPAHAIVNRDAWTARNAAYTDAKGRDNWMRAEITWGVFGVPESELRALPDVRGLDVVELGCGTAYFGAWLKRAGARRVVGVDVTPAQLATARRCEAEFQLGLEFVEANAEDVPLDSAQFDLAFSEYGASIWCEPRLWIGEAARLLRPGGELLFLRNSTLAMLCMPETGAVSTTLQRPLRSLHRMEWHDDDPGVEFHPSTGEMFRILRENRFELLDFRELYAPSGAREHVFYDYMPVEWGKQWPHEEIWHARLRRD